MFSRISASNSIKSVIDIMHDSIACYHPCPMFCHTYSPLHFYYHEYTVMYVATGPGTYNNSQMTSLAADLSKKSQ